MFTLTPEEKHTQKNIIVTYNPGKKLMAKRQNSRK